MKETRGYLVNTFVGLNENLKKYSGRLAYAVSRNMDWLERHYRNYERQKAPSEAMQEYEKERIALCEKMADKDETGSPKMIPKGPGVQSFVFSDQSAFDVALKELQEKYKEALDANKKQIKQLEADMELEEEVEWYKIKLPFSDLEKLDGAAMFPLMHFLEVTE